jgi:hypothetical protein
VYFAPHLSLDIDRREDLAAFVSRKSPTRTHDYLSRLNIQARLSTLPANAMSLVRAGCEVATHE